MAITERRLRWNRCTQGALEGMTPLVRHLHAIAPIVVIALGAACSCGSTGSTNEDLAPAAATPPALAAPPIPVITGVTFDSTSHRREAQGSDNWPATWSDDDNQYAVWGDGGGAGGDESAGRSSFGIARIEGDRGNYRIVNRFGGKRGECPSTIDGKGHGAPISLHGVLYVWITPKSGVAGYDSFTLYRSLDKGCTWSRLDVTFSRSTENISFGSFVQFGRDDALAADAYAYTLAAAISNADSLGVVQRPGRIMLLRVAVASIEDRGAYEYFAGLDATGQPIWSSESARKASIYEDADGVGPFPQMSYVPGLDRLVYTNEHGDGATSKNRQSLLTLAEAPHPWGPWAVIYRDVFLPDNQQTVFQWNFAPKWFSGDGREFTLIFSGDDNNDSWNTVNGTFSTQ